MSRDDQRSAFDGVAVVLLLAFLVVLLLTFAAGGLLYQRTVRAREQMLVAMERAKQAEEQALQERAMEQQRTDQSLDSIEAEGIPDQRDAPTQVPHVLRLDADGNAQLQNVTLDLATLRQLLEDSPQKDFVLWVHGNCEYRHVAALQQIFHSLGRGSPEMQLLDSAKAP